MPHGPLRSFSLNDLLVDPQSLCFYSVEQITVLTTFYVLFISTFIEGLLQKPSSSSDLPLIGPLL